MRIETIGDCTLYLGDCREIMRALPHGCFDACITDPPYLMGSASTRQGKGVKSRLGDWSNAAVWYSAWIGAVWERLADPGSLWVCGNWRSMPSLTMAMDEVQTNISSVVVWDKEWIGVGPLDGLRQRYELVFQAGKGSFRVEDRAEPDIWPVTWASQRPSGHDAEKPVDLMYRAVRVANAKTVLDPFMGSGTTGVACAKLGRRFIGIEIEPKYFEMAFRRIEAQAKAPDLFVAPPAKAEQLSLLDMD